MGESVDAIDRRLYRIRRAERCKNEYPPMRPEDAQNFARTRGNFGTVRLFTAPSNSLRARPESSPFPLQYRRAPPTVNRFNYFQAGSPASLISIFCIPSRINRQPTCSRFPFNFAAFSSYLRAERQISPVPRNFNPIIIPIEGWDGGSTNLQGSSKTERILSFIRFKRIRRSIRVKRIR